MNGDVSETECHLNTQRTGAIKRTFDVLIPLPNKIENEIEVVPSTEMSEEPPAIILVLKDEFQKLPHRPKVKVFLTVPHPDQYQIPPIMRFDIPRSVMKGTEMG